MSKALKLILWILLFVLIIGGAAFAYNRLAADYSPSNSGLVSQDSQEQEAEKEANDGDSSSDEADEPAPVAAPDFTVYDQDGNPVQLSERVGEKPAVLNFWASWCGPCKSEMPDLEQIYSEYSDRVDFLMINMTDGSRETMESANDFIQQSGYTFPVYYDSDMSAAAAYSVYSIPMTFIIDAEGNLNAYARGAISYEALRDALDNLLE